ncbi:MAG: hypothetical protein JSW51_10350 [Gemmatimonadota bacterium]|nr:MAG: hypothetical protein JSW51_10350 [Gemmatimonadota bacterium]
MSKRSKQALLVFAALYFLALTSAMVVWSVRNTTARLFAEDWFRDLGTQGWLLVSSHPLGMIVALELAGLVVLGYLWWLGDIKQRTWPKFVRKLAPLRQLMALLIFPIYVVISPVVFIILYLTFRENMTVRAKDRRQVHDPEYTGPERRSGAPRRTQIRRAFAGHPEYHSVT